MNDLTFNILKIVVSVTCALIAVYLVPYLKNKLQDDKYEQLLLMVTTAVQAAEQTIGTGQGKLKKAEVISFVSDWMNKNGIVISEDQLSQLIESAVFQMNLEIR